MTARLRNAAPLQASAPLHVYWEVLFLFLGPDSTLSLLARGPRGVITQNVVLSPTPGHPCLCSLLLPRSQGPLDR